MFKKKNLLRNSIIIVLGICIIVYLIKIIGGRTKFEEVEFGDLEEIIKAKGLVVKNEYIVNGAIDGTVTFVYEEGEKVSAGTHIATIEGGGQRKQVYSPTSGLVTYIFDGLEGRYNSDNVLNLNASSISNLEEVIENKKDKATVSSNQPMMKVVDNFSYYVACYVMNKGLEKFEVGKYARVRFNGTEQEVYGIVEKIESDGVQGIVIIRFDDFFYEIYNQRIIEIQIIEDIHSGIIIPKSALVEVDGINNVYVLDSSNIIRLFPVKIIGQNDDYFVIDEGEYITENGRRGIIINDERKFTVKVYDKVVINPENVYDGQIIN